DGDGRRNLAGSSAVSITDANVIFEGKLPVRKGSWLLTTRRTYYDLVAERFVDAQLPAFKDVQLKVAGGPPRPRVGGVPGPRRPRRRAHDAGLVREHQRVRRGGGLPPRYPAHQHA